jgi:poly(3-hydroxybutyrate) depolymerase
MICTRPRDLTPVIGTKPPNIPHRSAYVDLKNGGALSPWLAVAVPACVTAAAATCGADALYMTTKCKAAQAAPDDRAAGLACCQAGTLNPKTLNSKF